ncbi:MAG: DUF4188 domain-containing protein [Cocleimonas sp.]
MPDIYPGRMTALMNGNIEGEKQQEFVVFLIGMRINSWWKVHKWFPVLSAMPKMIKELYQNPEHGFIHQESWFGRTTLMVQYWKSFEHLEAYAKNRNAHHLPAWAEFNKKVANSGDVGVWHETYLVKEGCNESLYINMPRFGLAKAGKHVVLDRKSNTAKGRLAKKQRVE